MIDALVQLDRAWTLAINSLHTPFTDSMWVFFSGKTVWIPLYVLVVVLLIWRLGWKKGLVMILTTALCILCVDQFANLIKNAVARPRPGCDPEMLAAGLHVLIPTKSLAYGFFSAHAGNAMAFAVCSLKAVRMGRNAEQRPWKGLCSAYSILIVIWALMVGFSRIFVAKHFLGDVLTGFIVGLIFAEILCAISRLCFRSRPRP
ncbi:MAG: phosphatase PAP2 family protein [Bacteroidales bacterium]|nr:phosphatase PAP2 family protein [Bacteroidales bacterium]